MKLLVDMNLSPSWVGWLAGRGLEAVHWSTIGSAAAPDDEILSWARRHDFVVLTNDLDFSAILAATSDRAPSVVQLRAQDLLSEAAVSAVQDPSKRTTTTSSGARCCRSTRVARASECCLSGGPSTNVDRVAPFGADPRRRGTAGQSGYCLRQQARLRLARAVSQGSLGNAHLD